MKIGRKYYETLLRCLNLYREEEFSQGRIDEERGWRCYICLGSLEDYFEIRFGEENVSRFRFHKECLMDLIEKVKSTKN
jgi:hypothetical protein